MKLEELSERQAQILNVIRSSVKERGFPPSIREMVDACGMESTAGVFDQLRKIEAKGYIIIHDGLSRGITLR